MKGNRALNAYQTNQIRSRADVASPYKLVQITYENLLDNLARAAGAIERSDAKVRGECIGRCMDLINVLRSALDHSVGGEVPGNLDQLYRYCNRCLMTASRHDNLEKLDEVVGIISQIKSAWDELGVKLNGAG